MAGTTFSSSVGVTPTEAYLGKLARGTFLSLWSYQNLYRDVAKELADLVVLCGRFAIIFSDKNVKFDEDRDLKTAWQRWYNRAVLSSVKQLKRASGWVRNHPDRIFADAKCQQRISSFEINEPLEIYRIAVANGAAQACLNHFGTGSGSLIVSPSEDANSPHPFAVGNPAGEGEFVHVFDEAHLHIVLQELDTIQDFVNYLKAREKLLRNGNLVFSASEEDLLSVYLQDINEHGEHDWVIDSGKSLGEGDLIGIEEGSYLQLTRAEQYLRKKAADEKSYLWDALIEKFAKNFRDGTLAPLPDSLASNDGRFGGAEVALRYMALEHRLERRNHSEAILDAIEKLDASGGNRFFRAMLDANKVKETGFCILLLKRAVAPDDVPFEEYREFRCRMLAAYAEGLAERNRHLKRVVGIATEGEKGAPVTEDLVYLEPPEWTDEKIRNIRELEEGFEIFRKDMNFVRFGSAEYPEEAPPNHPSYRGIPYNFVRPPERPSNKLLKGNRKQRRAEAAKQRRRGRRR